MNGLYIYYSQIDAGKPTGVQKKILYQIKILSQNGNQCDVFYIDSERASKYRFFLGKIPLIGSKYNKWKVLPPLDKIDYLYVRRPSVFDDSFIRFFKRIKRKRPDIKIIVELPTFPYDAEYAPTLAGKFYLGVDKKYRNRLYNVVDRFAVVAYSGDDSIWGVPVLPIYNGIDLSEVSVKQRQIHDDINLLCIAYFSPWHGYEKFIEALKRYYEIERKKIVRMHMVGIGPELSKYKEIVRKNNLEQYVIFYGEVNGNLDDIYKIADIGLCSMRSQEIGLKLSSQLKSREYLARGLPIVTAGDIDILQKSNFEYEYVVKSGQDIDIVEIIEFFKNICESGNDKCTSEIRHFAEKCCGWEYAMKNVLTYLESIKF